MADQEEIKIFNSKVPVRNAPIPFICGAIPRTSIVNAMYEINSDIESISLIKDTLTLKPKSFGTFSAPPPYHLYEEKNEKILLPRTFGILQFGPPLQDNRTQNIDSKLDPSIFDSALILHPWQTQVVDHVYDNLLAPPLHSATLSAACGMGKTCMAIALLCKLKIKTAVIVHKEFLLSQWLARIKQFCPNIKIGKVQGDVFQIEHVTLVMIQTICNGKYDMKKFDEIKFVIVDECHHLAASTFHKCMRLFRARYTLGLSATLKRGDGNERAIFWFLGYPVVACTRKKNCKEDLRIEMVYTKSFVPEIRTAQKTLMYSKMLTNLIKLDHRTNTIVNNVVALHKQGRHILVISERIDLLDTIKRKLLDLDIQSAKYVGENSVKARKIRDVAMENNNIILTTRAMASEGFDRPIISAVVLATPLRQGANLEQSIGRCQRECKEKRHDNLIVDIVDNFSLFGTMAKGRERFYTSKGFVIKKIGFQKRSNEHFDHKPRI